MTTESRAGRVDPTQLRRVAVASAVGTTIEWYDYFIYSTAAALVFGSQFFSDAVAGVRHARRVRHARASASSPGRSAACSGATSATGSAARRCSSRRCC